jgi:alginate O-acetyltransferase complex protein AlgJ
LDEVHVGRDGWLFLQTGSNQVLRLFTDGESYPDALDAQWHQMLIDRNARLSALGIAYRHIVAPDKLSVFPEFTGLDLPLFDRAPLRRLADPARGPSRCLVDSTKALNHGNGELQTYFKTDSHWTIWGAYQAYRLTCESLGVPAVDFMARPVGRYPVCFDLGSKLTPPVHEDHMFWPPSDSITRAYANALVIGREQSEKNGGPSPGHHGTHIILRNTATSAIPRRLVLFGDSFSDYRPSSLTYLFAETFQEVHFVWSTDVDTDYARRVKADAVVSEIAERFMTRLPTDTLCVERNTADLVKAFNENTARDRANLG